MSLTKERIDRSKPVRVQAASMIEEQFFTAIFSPGEEVPQLRLSKRLGLSQPTIREALQELEHRGLVVRMTTCLSLSYWASRTAPVAEVQRQPGPVIWVLNTAAFNLRLTRITPCRMRFPDPGVYQEEQQRTFEFLKQLNQFATVKYPDNPAMRARIKSYELAFRMQTAIPEVFRFSEESEVTHRLYGLDQEETKSFGQRCLTARRLVERGVRFVQVYHGGGTATLWDAHASCKRIIARCLLKLTSRLLDC